MNQPREVRESTVLIIGAGPAGLAVGATLRQAGISAILLEQGSSVGSRWHQHYERLHLHTAARTSALPLLPFPAEYPTYPSRQQVIDYLEAYTRQFQLDVRLNCQVTGVHHTVQGWQAVTSDGIYKARYLVVAIGLNNTPRRPVWPHQDQFAGQIIHSADYRNGAAFRDQPVLVVGFGNSGAEIVLDLAEHGAKAAVSVRHPVNVVRRDLYGLPIQWWSILLSYLPARLADLVNLPSSLLYFGDLERYGLRKPAYGPATQTRQHRSIPVIDVGTIQKIREGKIKVYPAIDQFTPSGVRFTNGTTADFAAVILATGYEINLQSIFGDVSLLLDADDYPLVSGQETALPNLYLCGLHNASGGLLREINFEARHIARAIQQKETT